MMLKHEKIGWGLILFIFAAIIVLLIIASYRQAHAQPSIYAQDGTYLGQLSANPYLPDSTANPYGVYGSPYSGTSINNPYSVYGSPYSSQSPNNPYAPGGGRAIPDIISHGAVQGEW